MGWDGYFGDIFTRTHAFNKKALNEGTHHDNANFDPQIWFEGGFAPTRYSAFNGPVLTGPVTAKDYHALADWAERRAKRIAPLTVLDPFIGYLGIGAGAVGVGSSIHGAYTSAGLSRFLAIFGFVTPIIGRQSTVAKAEYEAMAQQARIMATKLEFEGLSSRSAAGRAQSTVGAGLPTQRSSIVFPRSTFNLFGDLTTMTTAALEREQRESRLAYDGLTAGAGQVASRFEPENQSDLDVAQAVDDVTLHGSGRFVPQGSLDSYNAVSDSAIPEPRVKPETYRMLRDRSVPVPTTKPDRNGMPPDGTIPVPVMKPDLPPGP